MSAIPSVIALPQEMRLGEVDYSLPPAARNIPMKILPTNVTSVTSSTVSYGSLGANAYLGDIAFPTQQIIFDLPAGVSPSMFIDPRKSSLNFRVLINNTAVASQTVAGCNMRSSAYSWFDRQWLQGQNGVLEDITELGLVADSMMNFQQNWAQKIGNAIQYGFEVETGAGGLTGRTVQMYNSQTTANGASESMAFSVPIISSLIGVTANKFLNIGRTSKLQYCLNTASIAPLTFLNGGTVQTTGSFTVTITDIFLNIECIDIGMEALQTLDASLVDNKAYISGQTYRTSSSTISAGASGSQSLLVGLRGSSIKSLFARFQDGGATTSTNNSINGKYDSKLPNANSICFNIQGTGRIPNIPVNPLLSPANSMRETQMAIGSYNTASMTSSSPPQIYCKLCYGGTAQAYTNGSTQDYYWSLGSSNAFQCTYLFGVNTEICARRGLFSGLNCLTSPIFLELNIANAVTNSVTAYVIGLLDVVYVHDCQSGDISVRI